MSRWIRFGTAVMVLVLLGACTSMRTQPDWQQSVRVGDQVRVWKLPSGVVDLKVTSVTPEALEGQVEGESASQRIPAAEIRRVERREVDGVKTGKGVGIGALGIGIALFAAFLLLF